MRIVHNLLSVEQLTKSNNVSTFFGKSAKIASNLNFNLLMNNTLFQQYIRRVLISIREICLWINAFLNVAVLYYLCCLYYESELDTGMPQNSSIFFCVCCMLTDSRKVNVWVFSFESVVIVRVSFLLLRWLRCHVRLSSTNKF